MLLDSPAIATYVLAVTAVLGLVMGSFLNCLAWRLVHGESVLSGRSHCATCNHVLGPRDLVPVASWLASGRKCRYCGDPVSARYPATELLCAAAYVLIVWRYGLTLEAVELAAFASILLVASLVDLDERIIPDGCIVAALAVRVAYLAASAATGGRPFLEALGESAFSGVVVGAALLAIVLVSDLVLRAQSMGGGDLKLYFTAACYFGWAQSILLVFLSCVFGLVMAAAGAAAGRGGEQGVEAARPAEGSAGTGSAPEAEAASDAAEPPARPRHVIVFGPAISAACLAVMLVGADFVGWYVSMLL